VNPRPPGIPVAETIRFAYAFAFGQIGAIIGLVWLPLMLMAFLQFLPYAIGTTYPASDTQSAAATGDALFNLVCSTGVVFLYAMNSVSVTRQALGLRQGAASFHFAFGWPEWRMFAAIVVCGLLLVAAAGTYVLLGSVFLLRLAGLWSGIVADAYTLIGFCLLVWFALRLVFLVAPVVVAEERFDLVRAFLLTGRNFWQIFAILLVVAVPLLILQCLALAFIVGPAFFAPLPSDAAAAAVAVQQRFALFDRHMPSVIGLTLILTPFNLGLVLGAASRAYRALVPAKTALN